MKNSIKNRKLNESKDSYYDSKYKSFINKQFNGAMDLDIFNIVADVLNRIDFNEYKESDDKYSIVYEEVDSCLTWIEDQWRVLEYYVSSPSDLTDTSWDDAYSDFVGDIEAICDNIVNSGQDFEEKLDTTKKPVYKKTKEYIKEAKALTEASRGEYSNIISDLVDRAQSMYNDGNYGDRTDCINQAISDGLIYSDDIVSLAMYYGTLDDGELIESYYDDLYNDIDNELEDPDYSGTVEYKIYDIEYDLDDDEEQTDLPTELTVEIDVDDYRDDNEVYDKLYDAIYEETGYSAYDFKYQEVETESLKEDNNTPQETKTEIKKVTTPRGTFEVVDKTEDELRKDGYGYHHSGNGHKIFVKNNQAVAIKESNLKEYWDDEQGDDFGYNKYPNLTFKYEVHAVDDKDEDKVYKEFTNKQQAVKYAKDNKIKCFIDEVTYSKDGDFVQSDTIYGPTDLGESKKSINTNKKQLKETLNKKKNTKKNTMNESLKTLKEANDSEETKLAKFLQDCLNEGLDFEGLKWYDLDGDFSVSVGWMPGYDKDDISVVDDNGYGLCVMITECPNTYAYADFESLMQPYNEETGDVYDTCMCFEYNEDCNALAKWYLEQYDEIKSLLNKGEITID